MVSFISTSFSTIIHMKYAHVLQMLNFYFRKNTFGAYNAPPSGALVCIAFIVNFERINTYDLYIACSLSLPLELIRLLREQREISLDTVIYCLNHLIKPITRTCTDAFRVLLI